MFKFIKNIFGKNKKEKNVTTKLNEIENSQVKDKKEPKNTENVKQTKSDFSLFTDEQKSPYYTKAVMTYENIKNTKYKNLTENLKKVLSSADKASFAKENLESYLTDAENIVNEENEKIKEEGTAMLNLKASVSAIEDIFRIERLIKDIPNKISELEVLLQEINQIVLSLDDTDDIIEISEKLDDAKNLLNDISYALRFTFDRLELLVDKESQHDSIKFYTIRYEEYSSLYNNLSARLSGLKELKDSLDQKLRMFAKKAKAMKSNGLINLDWDGKKYNVLLKMRNDIEEGYSQVESGCSLVSKNCTAIIQNVINSDSEFIQYIYGLIPKLSANVDLIKPKYAEIKDKYEMMYSTIKLHTEDLKFVIDKLNLLY